MILFSLKKQLYFILKGIRSSGHAVSPHSIAELDFFDRSLHVSSEL